MEENKVDSMQDTLKDNMLSGNEIEKLKFIMSGGVRLGINSPYRKFSRLTRNTRHGTGRGKAKNRRYVRPSKAGSGNKTKLQKYQLLETGFEAKETVESRDGTGRRVYRYDQRDTNGRSLVKGYGICKH